MPVPASRSCRTSCLNVTGHLLQFSMYKPPQNSNRVKSIRSKFEEIENKKATDPVNLLNNKTIATSLKPSLKQKKQNSAEASNKQVLNRQWSDPARRNVKRTPAFRLDKNSESNCDYNRGVYNRNTLLENKIKQFNNVGKNCDAGKNMIQKSVVSDDKFSNTVNATRPILFKSKSSLNFQYNNEDHKEQQISKISKIDNSDNVLLEGLDLSLLYTEPIPKFLRHVKKIKEAVEVHQNGIDNIYNKSTLKLTDKKEVLNSLRETDLSAGLTNSLKSALAKPLPCGPAPKKPPRTFQHPLGLVSPNNSQKNTTFLLEKTNEEKIVNSKIVANQIPVPKKLEKSDPKYMLNKLENALKNNKLRVRRQENIEIYSTSGEDSDESILFSSKSSCALTKLPHTHRTTPTKCCKPQMSESLLGSFNCFNGRSCTKPPYARIKEPSSSFFVSEDNILEPLYAEPCHLRKDSNQDQTCGNKNLYYMMSDLKDAPFSVCESDFDRNAAPATDDAHTKIRHLIEAFDTLKMRDSVKSQIAKNQTGGTSSSLHKLEKNDILTNDVQVNGDSSTRIEQLKSSLKLALDHSFKNEKFGSGDSDIENLEGESSRVSDLITKFQTYSKTAPKYCTPKINKNTLFYCCLVIEKVKDCAQIKFKFPAHVAIPPEIEQLCFPENSNCPPLDCSSAAQTYSLLITNQTGERMFGYCRRVLPEGSVRCLPLAYCILSKNRSPRFYKKILTELESRHGMQNWRRDELISQFYNKNFPQPGESIVINLSRIEPGFHTNNTESTFEESVDLTSYVNVRKSGEYSHIDKLKLGDWIFISDADVKESCRAPSYIAYEEQKMELVITLHFDTRYEDTDLRSLHNLPSDILLKVFSSLLLERKVIFISSFISKLSSCVDSLQSILYPFTWYHTLIPILPESLWDIVESPTPVICGVLSKEAVIERKIENGIVVNLDTNTVLMEEGDEMKILSSGMQKVWKRGIALANRAATAMDYVQSVYLADAYLQVFIFCLKNYKEFLVDGTFLKAEFLKNTKGKGTKRFLNMFTETCMFHAFIDSALQNPKSLEEFDKKIRLYSSDDCNIILDKLLEWNR
ncbi:uncharacterized protein LOC132703415 isoform X2 [Cylas formicarius]|uniref:uncharacterized protein LOC132703415 isoform X2 n=1 Tax=Cylas formicarius TaxID=197179 RepID=UPI002958CA76|nr:uncharacterized protein LOC132703415 isoform X2 [Cylas formicarius]